MNAILTSFVTSLIATLINVRLTDKMSDIWQSPLSLQSLVTYVF